ncbi:hypothetical protein MC885_010066 [Smutsia gigantea]|nr:hypothetical protein MC885_010066 [Smutsia gigantea]
MLGASDGSPAQASTSTQPPAEDPPSAVGSPAAAPQQPGLMAQVAAAAAGMAVGSARHALGHATTWGFGGGGNAELPRSDVTYQEPQGAQPTHLQQQQVGPCHRPTTIPLNCHTESSGRAKQKWKAECLETGLKINSLQSTTVL